MKRILITFFEDGANTIMWYGVPFAFIILLIYKITQN